MHSRAGGDYRELLLEARKWTTMPSGLCHAARPQGLVAVHVKIVIVVG